jgi:hypothetical protein
MRVFFADAASPAELELPVQTDMATLKTIGAADSPRLHTFIAALPQAESRRIGPAEHIVLFLQAQ